MRDDFCCLDGLFPRVDAAEPECGPDDLHTDFETFVNYKGVEADPAVFGILKSYRQKG